MQRPASPPAAQGSHQVPPEVASYLKGPTPESAQFDFLIGEWEVSATRYREDGSVLMHYPARWHAVHLNGGRMVMDDFQALAPTGQAVSSYVTLRTHSPVTGRWEMAGLAAFQPAVPAEWHGRWNDGEMQLDATGRNAAGQAVRTRIRFFDIGRDRFAWESTSSLDDSPGWVRTASLVATRAPR